MSKTKGSPVAIVPKLDTGIIKSSEGEEDGSRSEVICDRCQSNKSYENVDLVCLQMGAGHGGFDGSELDTDLPSLFGKKFPHLTIRVEFYVDSQRKRRIAKFQFLRKPLEKSRAGDPFYVHVINGKAIYKPLGTEKAS